MLRPRKGAVRISAGFWLLTVWFGMVNGWRLLATVLSAAAIHELGHLLALWWSGAPIRGLRLGLLGAELEADRGALSYGREVLAVLAGPLANLLWGGALALLGGDRTAVGAHLVLAAFNLLPLRPLDGGVALALAVSWAAGPAAGEWAARCVGVCAAAGLAAVLIWLMDRSGGTLWLLPALFGLLRGAFCEICGENMGK